ncbi:hypothetical protein J2T20_004218 [Paenibacillus wynnii]|nr:hypothetical protein [Paenibacillus wynnii]
MSVFRVPPGKRFSVCTNGARRTCAVAQITYGTATTFVVEVARPDDWSISTLILRSTDQSSFRIIERNIKLLLESLVEKSVTGISMF